jgi:histone deacetylase complex regulatory component SIN3
VEGDVVLECIHLDKYLEVEEVMFRVMFNTKFIQSHILVLTLDDIDLAWECKDNFSKDFKAEVINYFLIFFTIYVSGIALIIILSFDYFVIKLCAIMKL